VSFSELNRLDQDQNEDRDAGIVKYWGRAAAGGKSSVSVAVCAGNGWREDI
jgi:hypothetical protein